VDRIPLRQGRRTSVNCSIATSKNLASACGVSRGGGTRKRRHAAGAARGHPWRGQRPSVPALSKRSRADAGKYDKESQGILTKPARVDLHRLNQLGKDLRHNGPSRRTSLGQPSSIVVRSAPVARKLPAVPSSSVFFTETGTNRSHKATALIPYCFYGKSAGPSSLHSNGPILLWMGLSYVLVPVFGQGAAIRSPQQRFHVGELPRPKNRSREATRTP